MSRDRPSEKNSKRRAMAVKAFQMRKALSDFIAWAEKANDEDDECGYLNGDSKKYPGDGWKDLRAITRRAKAALSEPTP